MSSDNSWPVVNPQDVSQSLDSFRFAAASILRSLNVNSLDQLCQLHQQFAKQDCGCSNDLADKLRRMLYSSSPDLNVKRVALAFAIGLPILDGHSQTEYARLLGAHRATLSKWVNFWQDHLGLPPNQYTNPNRARAGNVRRDQRRTGSAIRSSSGRWVKEHRNKL